MPQAGPQCSAFLQPEAFAFPLGQQTREWGSTPGEAQAFSPKAPDPRDPTGPHKGPGRPVGQEVT